MDPGMSCPGGEVTSLGDITIGAEVVAGVVADVVVGAVVRIDETS